MMNAVLQGTWPALDQDGHKVGDTPMLTHRKYDIDLIAWAVVFAVALGCLLSRVL
jgi:hypothetical protein